MKRVVVLIFLILVPLAMTKAVARAESGAVGGGTWETATRGETSEKHISPEGRFRPWLLDPAIFGEDPEDLSASPAGPAEDQAPVITEVKTVKMANVLPPIQFPKGKVEIPEQYTKQLRRILDDLHTRANVRLHFIGHWDSLPLEGVRPGRLSDPVGLSREMASTTAEYFRHALKLPPAAVSFEGMGDRKPLVSNLTAAGRAHNRRVEVEVWYDEGGELPEDEKVSDSPPVNRENVCRSETVCKYRYRAGYLHRARLKNLIAPMHYDGGEAGVPQDFLADVRQALLDLGDKNNVVVKFIAYTDAPPAGSAEVSLDDQLALSKLIAWWVGLAFQEGLGLPPSAIESEGRGATRPVASNETPLGRAMNRRIEVEFWYDDPLQDLPEEPQLCPEAPEEETVTTVYYPPEGKIAPILFEGGEPVLPPDFIDRLRGILAAIGDKDNVRLRFIGYLDNARLDRRTSGIYNDDIGWSTARAQRAMEVVSEQLGLTKEQAEFEGRGFVPTLDFLNGHFVESTTSGVEVEVVYDELVEHDDYEGIDITQMTREVRPADPYGLNLMRITIDGKPLDDPGKSRADVQRCTDVALDQASIQFKYDNLRPQPRLNVTAWPRTIHYRGWKKTGPAANLVRFRLYTNYHSFIKRTEVRIFDEGQSVRDTPLEVVALDDQGLGEWRARFKTISATGRELKYLVRVYDRAGRFDETAPQTLWVVDRPDIEVTGDDTRELLAGYGESRIASRNITLNGGLVRARGASIPAGHSVWLAGYPVPVDGRGRFIAEEILPAGRHTVEVAVLDPAGNGELFRRDLELAENDWFTVGIADLTLAQNKDTGPAELLVPDQKDSTDKNDMQGRLAFYTKGKFGAGWGLTASADTREGPLDEIFSNFLDKSPESLFRRIDPDYYYPTYGDDGTVEEDAPTSGKFYLKLNKEENYGLWGNFKAVYTENELAQVDRGLYGGHLHFQSSGVTSFGERRYQVDDFFAEPGTVAGRDEFRGTGGSLYFLHRQDLLEGSERVRIEVRDKDSGLVLGVKNLTPVLDYQVDYLQGRLVLAQPLASTADDALLVQSDSLGGNPVYLVVRYEFTPGLEELDTTAVGGRVHFWLGDKVKVGVTASRDGEAGSENNLNGADVTFRQSAATWIKVETGQSTGSDLTSTSSKDGGFNFGTSDLAGDSGGKANAYRTEVSIGLQDFNDEWQGRMTMYGKGLEAGYAAPGQVAERDTSQYGGTVQLPLSELVQMHLKIDKLEVDEGLETQAGELNFDYRIEDYWTLSSGVRFDSREDHSPVVPLTQEEGDRTDVVVKALYDPETRWSAYGFAQESAQRTGTREKNGRFGIGGDYRVTDRFKMNGEISAGDLGMGERLGTEYLYSDRTTLYLNYTLEDERTDNGMRARKGNLASGFRTRYSDSASVYFEERYTHGEVPTGLLHSAGVELAPTDHLNLGANVDLGTLQDNRTGAELKRSAIGVSAGFGLKTLKFTNAVEFRRDNTEQPDTSTTERTTWLFKNSLKYQLSQNWRLLGKFNYAQSESSQGQFFDGNYTEAVIGYAYRPVEHDRLNALFKYTYFYNVPAVEQLTQTGSGADVIQRSHIAALDVMYDLTPSFTLGGKYAYRLGQVSLDRVDQEFFESRASLYILRVDWHLIHRWDALVEGRLLDLPDAGDNLSGALVGVYRHVGNYLKLGVGYNFSKFSDDLTDLSYDHQGLFINLIGKI